MRTLCILTLGILTLSAPAAAQHNAPLDVPVLWDGAERVVLRALAPLSDGSALEDGWRLRTIRLERETLTLRCTREGSDDALLMVERAWPTNDAPPAADPLAAAESLAAAGLRVRREGPAPPIDALLQHLGQGERAATLASAWRVPDALPTGEALRVVHRRADELEDLGQSTALRMLFLLLVLLVWTAAAWRRPGGSRGLPWLWMLGVVALAAGWRLWLSPDAPLSAWSWRRTNWTVGRLFADTILRRYSSTTPVALDEVRLLAQLTLASLTPLVVGAHAALLSRDRVVGLATALILACSPHHIRFSASDVGFIPSLFWSSGAFVALYAVVHATHWPRRLFASAVFAALLTVTFLARPLNLLYGPLMLAAVWMATSGRRRYATALVALGALGGALFLLHDQADGVSRGLGLKTIRGGLTTLLDLGSRNPLTYPGLTPLVTAPLVVLGCLGWWRAGRDASTAREDGDSAATHTPLSPRDSKTRVLWLLAWLIGFVMAHGAVLVDEPLNNARYQLHALAPIVILTAIGLRVLSQRAHPAWAGALLALLMAAPLLHRDAITELDFAVVHERAFVEAAAKTLPKGCTVLEVLRETPYNSPTPRFGRAGRYRQGQRVQTPVQAIVAARVPWLGTKDDVEPEVRAPPQNLGDPRRYLTEAGREALQNPPACLVFYAGAHCKPAPGEGGEHPVCQAIRSARPFQRTQTKRLQTQRYDGAEYSHLIQRTDTLELTLYKANTKANPAPWLSKKQNQ